MPSGDFLLSLISTVAPDPKDVAARVDKVRSENPNADRRQVAEHVADKIAWMYAGQGAALALPGAIPGLGTAAVIAVEGAAISADLALMTRNFVNMTMSVACAYDHDVHSQERLHEALIVAELWVGALKPAGEAAARIGTKIAAAQVKKIPAELLKRINRLVGTTLLTKYGTKRGGIALGKVIPFGVGVLVGGGFNLATMKGVKQSALKYYNDVIPGGQELGMEG